MFSLKYQGGALVEVFVPRGRDPVKMWKVRGHVKKQFDKSVRSFVYHVEGGQNTMMVLPADRRQTLGLKQPFLVVQLKLPAGGELFACEFSVSDTSGHRHRLVFSTAFKSCTSNSLHTQFPMKSLSRSIWTNACFALGDLLASHRGGAQFVAIDSIQLQASCQVRNIFTLKTRPPASGPSVEVVGTEAIPHTHDFPHGCPAPTATLVFDRVSMVETSTPVKSTGGKPRGSPSVHVAFGHRSEQPPSASKRQRRSTPGKARTRSKTRSSPSVRRPRASSSRQTSDHKEVQATTPAMSPQPGSTLQRRHLRVSGQAAVPSASTPPPPHAGSNPYDDNRQRTAPLTPKHSPLEESTSRPIGSRPQSSGMAQRSQVGVVVRGPGVPPPVLPPPSGGMQSLGWTSPGAPAQAQRRSPIAGDAYHQRQPQVMTPPSRVSVGVGPAVSSAPRVVAPRSQPVAVVDSAAGPGGGRGVYGSAWAVESRPPEDGSQKDYDLAAAQSSPQPRTPARSPPRPASGPRTPAAAEPRTPSPLAFQVESIRRSYEASATAFNPARSVESWLSGQEQASASGRFSSASGTVSPIRASGTEDDNLGFIISLGKTGADVFRPGETRNPDHTHTPPRVASHDVASPTYLSPGLHMRSPAAYTAKDIVATPPRIREVEQAVVIENVVAAESAEGEVGLPQSPILAEDGTLPDQHESAAAWMSEDADEHTSFAFHPNDEFEEGIQRKVTITRHTPRSAGNTSTQSMPSAARYGAYPSTGRPGTAAARVHSHDPAGAVPDRPSATRPQWRPDSSGAASVSSMPAHERTSAGYYEDERPATMATAHSRNVPRQWRPSSSGGASVRSLPAHASTGETIVDARPATTTTAYKPALRQSRDDDFDDPSARTGEDEVSRQVARTEHAAAPPLYPVSQPVGTHNDYDSEDDHLPALSPLRDPDTRSPSPVESGHRSDGSDDPAAPLSVARRLKNELKEKQRRLAALEARYAAQFGDVTQRLHVSTTEPLSAEAGSSEHKVEPPRPHMRSGSEVSAASLQFDMSLGPTSPLQLQAGDLDADDNSMVLMATQKFTSTPKPTVPSNPQSDMELIYDPLLACYFDPKTNKYYEYEHGN